MSVVGGARPEPFAVEHEARWRLWLLFGLLLVAMIATIWLAMFVVSVIAYLIAPVPGVLRLAISRVGLTWVLGGALVFSLLYWMLSLVGARKRLCARLHAHAPDPHDAYHRRLVNVVEEIRLATGSPPIDCFVVDTLGMNAFAFSDLRGRGCIGLTEGALARLARPQLQGVVAHEFAHILSGSYVTTTVSCLLFGLFTDLGESVEGSGGGGALSSVAAGLGGGIAMLAAFALRALVALADLVTSLVSAGMSRANEREADVAAARFTRDPVALAQALRTMSRHPGGAGYIPAGLAPLCIRPAEFGAGPLHGLLATHPPVEARIATLLHVANMGWAEFEQQAAQADETMAEREDTAANGPARPATPEGARSALTAWALAGAAPSAAAAPPTLAPMATAVPVRVAVPGAPGENACPSCGAALERATYEGLDLLVCRRCGGRLASTDQISRVLARRELRFTPEQQRMADYVAENGDRIRRAALLARGKRDVALVPCPRCGQTMMRGHYNYEFAVEIDRCALCDLTWFEKDELEVLQILVERQL
jgi:Zn-dependent protease with chaperone function/Zn-finger nucleic acid-binding protein